MANPKVPPPELPPSDVSPPVQPAMANPQVTPLVEIWHDGGFLVSEANGHQSRDTIQLTGGVKVLAGTVLGLLTSGASAGSWAPLNPAAADGSELAGGVLCGARDVTFADRAAVAVTRSAEVNTSELVWPSTATPAQIATAIAQLQMHGILAR
ncbi:head decoration protein [Paraburkholderia sediminicola]|uniref:head decoration protein n=1 Tax=Paraburkholderia sediminicola TaxID=458836 RepID=UPI0038BC1DA6